MTPDKIAQFQTTRAGRAIYGMAALVVAYIFGSLAINSGSLWEWAVAIILLITGINNLVKLVWSFVHAQK